MKLKPYTPGEMLLPAERPPMVKENPERRRLYDYAVEHVEGFTAMSTFKQHQVLQRLREERQ